MGTQTFILPFFVHESLFYFPLFSFFTSFWQRSLLIPTTKDPNPILTITLPNYQAQPFILTNFQRCPFFASLPTGHLSNLKKTDSSQGVDFVGISPQKFHSVLIPYVVGKARHIRDNRPKRSHLKKCKKKFSRFRRKVNTLPSSANSNHPNPQKKKPQKSAKLPTKNITYIPHFR